MILSGLVTRPLYKTQQGIPTETIVDSLSIYKGRRELLLLRISLNIVCTRGTLLGTEVKAGFDSKLISDSGTYYIIFPHS